MSCSYSSDEGDIGRARRYVVNTLATVTTLREYLVLTFSLGVTSNEFTLVITPPYLPC